MSRIALCLVKFPLKCHKSGNILVLRGDLMRTRSVAHPDMISGLMDDDRMSSLQKIMSACSLSYAVGLLSIRSTGKAEADFS